MKRLIVGACLVTAALSLSACGSTGLDRTLSGAGLGGATGAVAGAIVGGPILGAAAIGAAAGGVIGAVTDSGTINLGKPIWR